MAGPQFNLVKRPLLPYSALLAVCLATTGYHWFVGFDELFLQVMIGLPWDFHTSEAAA
jgi:hypothetical protein